MLACPKFALTSCLLRNVLAVFKRPRFKKVGMKRAKKAKIEVDQAETIVQERIAVAGGDQAAVPATLPLHTGVAAALACADKLQQHTSRRNRSCNS